MKAMASGSSCKQVFSRLLVLTAFGIAACAPALTGRPAPDFRLEDSSGRIWTLDDFRGKNSVVLVFYHSHG